MFLQNWVLVGSNHKSYNWALCNTSFHKSEYYHIMIMFIWLQEDFQREESLASKPVLAKAWWIQPTKIGTLGQVGTSTCEQKGSSERHFSNGVQYPHVPFYDCQVPNKLPCTHSSYVMPPEAKVM